MPLGTDGNANPDVPAVTVSGAPPFKSSVSPLPVRPLIVPPTAKLLVVQLTATLVMFAFAVPLCEVSVQVCVGFDGCDLIVTL